MLDDIENIERKMGLSNTVRIMFGSDEDEQKRVYRKIDYVIPIHEQNGRFITYQNLTYAKMTGQESLTVEEQRKYPIVINPELPYKLRHNTYLTKDNPMDRILIILAYASGKIAIDRDSYQGGNVHDGYFVDKQRNAIKVLNLHDKKREAYDIISKIPSEQLAVYCNVAKLQRGVSLEDFEELVNDTLRTQALYNQIDKDPGVILQLSEKNNPSFKDQIFVAFAEKNDLIRRRGIEFHLCEHGILTTPMGKTVTQVVSFLRDNINIRDMLMRELTELEPYYRDSTNAILYKDTNIDTITEALDIAITGGEKGLKKDHEKAKELLAVIHNKEGRSGNFIKYSKEMLRDQANQEIEQIRVDYRDWDREQIRGYNIRIKDQSVKDGLAKTKDLPITDEEYIKTLEDMRVTMMERKIEAVEAKFNKQVESIKTIKE
jgi:hypothetical protein